MTLWNVLTLCGTIFGPLMGFCGIFYGVRINNRQNHMRLEFDRAQAIKDEEREEDAQRDRRATEWREDYMTARREMDALRTELRNMHAEHQVEISNLRREHSEEITALRTEHDDMLAELRAQHDRDLNETRNENARLRVRIADMEAELSTNRVVASVTVSTPGGP